MRAMWLHYPSDPRVRALGTQYLWGRDLLVAPVFENGATSRDVYLPGGDWYDWWTGARIHGGRSVTRAVDLATMPIYVRAGAIIPVDPVRQFTSEPVTEATQIRLYPGADGDFTLYDDDGVSQAYLSGVATTTRLMWNDRAKLLTIMPAAAQAEATRIAARRQFDVVVGPQGPTRRVQYDGRRMQLRF